MRRGSLPLMAALASVASAVGFWLAVRSDSGGGLVATVFGVAAIVVPAGCVLALAQRRGRSTAEGVLIAVVVVLVAAVVFYVVFVVGLLVGCGAAKDDPCIT